MRLMWILLLLNVFGSLAHCLFPLSSNTFIKKILSQSLGPYFTGDTHLFMKAKVISVLTILYDS